MEKYCTNCKHWKDPSGACKDIGCLTNNDDRVNFSKWEPAVIEPEPSVRRTILEQAISCVCTDRDAQYGSPEDSFKAIAELWTAYMGQTFTAHDVGMLLALLKVGRIKTGHFKEDSYVDAAGYIACAAQCAKEE